MISIKYNILRNKLCLCNDILAYYVVFAVINVTYYEYYHLIYPLHKTKVKYYTFIYIGTLYKHHDNQEIIPQTNLYYMKPNDNGKIFKI